MRQFLILTRSVFCWDFVIVARAEGLDARFSHLVGRTTPGHSAAPGQKGRRKVWFAFADAKIHSGQREASRLTYTALDPAEWDIRMIVTPGFEHDRAGIGRWFRYFTRLVVAWAGFTPLLFERSPLLHMNVGQTWMSLIRDGLPLRALRWLRPDAEVVLMTQGSLFMTWRSTDRIARMFANMISGARAVTVLGPHQSAKLTAFGVPSEKVIISNNTCGTDGIDAEEIAQKHLASEPVRLLYLSTLIDTKGYPDFLEALEIVGASSGPRVEVVLCGRILVTEHSRRFQTVREASDWIRHKIEHLNRSQRVSICWYEEGADADAKWLLYRRAHIFALPSYYPVEAQPIVLVEAMAHGCAIVTTRAGEIEAMFQGRDAATMLDRVSAANIAAAIEELIRNPDLRKKRAVEARRLFEAGFSPSTYAQRWDALLRNGISRRVATRNEGATTGVGALESRRLVIISQVFYPDSQVTGALLSDLSVELQAAGFECEVLTGFPADERESHDSRIPRRELWRNITIRRGGVRSRFKRSLLLRLLSYASFSAWQIWRLLFFVPRSANVIVVTNPPFSPLVVAGCSLVRGWHYHVLLHDVYPDGLVAVGALKRDGWAAGIWRILNRYALTNAANVLVLGRDMARMMIDRYGVMPSRVGLVPNWSPHAGNGNLPAEAARLWTQLKLEGTFVVQYSGNMGLWHDIDCIVHAAHALKAHSDIVFLMIGEGRRRQAAQNLASSLGVSNMIWLPFQPEAELPDSLACCQAALISLRSNLEGIAVPSKLYSIMASGRAVVAQVPGDSEVARVVEEEKCGLVVTPADAEGLASAIRRLHLDRKFTGECGKRARQAYELKYTVAAATTRYVEILSRAAALT